MRTGAVKPAMPLWFRLVYSAFVAMLVPVYATHYPLTNFLWFSNLALLGGLVGAWTGAAAVTSMLLVAVGLVEMGWIADFLGGLILGGRPPFGMVGYMFDPGIPLAVRGLSLYHLLLPIALFWMVWRFGYDEHAWRRLIPIGWAVIIVTRLVVAPEDNVNFALHPPWLDAGIEGGLGWLWAAGVMAVAAFVWWLTHRLVSALLRACDRHPR